MSSLLSYKPGDLLGPDLVIQEIHKGGMGEVFLCEYQKDTLFALKTLKPEFFVNNPIPEVFKNEAMTWTALEDHVHIVRCFGIYPDTYDKRPFIWLEWIKHPQNDYVTLREWIKRRPLKLMYAISFAIQICRGLIYADTKVPGLVHCDLKPSNILIGANDIVKISDFGISRLNREENLFGTNWRGKEAAFRGSTPYLSPEQWRNEDLDQRTDIYALGCILYEMVIGVVPFLYKTESEARDKHLNAPIPQIPNKLLPDSFNRLLTKCLAKQKDDRYSETKHLLGHLTWLYKEYFGSDPPIYEFSDFDKKASQKSRLSTYLFLNEYQLGIEKINETINIDGPYNSELLTLLGNIQMKDEQLHQALDSYTSALEKDNSNEIAFIGRGEVHLKLLQFDRAENDFRSALELNSSSERAYTGLSLIEVEHDRLNEAKKLLAKAFELDNDEIGFIQQIVLHEIVHSNFQLGEKYLDLATQIDETNQNLIYLQTFLNIKQRDYLTAIKYLDNLVSEKFDLIKTLQLRAFCYFYISDLESCYADLDKVVELFRELIINNQFNDVIRETTLYLKSIPNDPDVLELRSYAHYSLGEYQKALDDLDRIVQLAPENLTVRSQRAFIFYELRDFKTAIIEAKKLLNNELSHRYHFLLGLSYLQLDASNEAINAFTNALALKPDFDFALAERGRCFYNLGEKEKGQKDLEVAKKLNPDLASIYYKAGKEYFENKEYKKAKYYIDLSDILGDARAKDLAEKIMLRLY